jgi:hypothetical protein
MTRTVKIAGAILLVVIGVGLGFGVAAPKQSTSGGGVGTVTVNVAFNDPCTQSVKSFRPISVTANTQLITGVAAKNVYICSVEMVPNGPDNVAFVEGTGTTCGTGTAGIAGGATAATGLNLAQDENVHFGNGIGSVMATATQGDNVCILVSASTQVSGVMGYVIQ